MNKIERQEPNKTLILSITFLFLILLLLCSFNAVSAKPYSNTMYVNGSSGSDVNDGSSWLTAKKTIGNATGSVTNNGEIYIANGTYKGDKNNNIIISHNMTITGMDQKGTVVYGDSSAIFIVNQNVILTINNLTLTQAASAVSNDGTITLNHCTLTNNQNEAGAGIFNTGTATLSKCTLSNNTAEDGGAIANYGILNIYSSTLENNTAEYNAGAIFSDHIMNIYDSTIRYNSADILGKTNGGAIRCTGTTYISNTLIEHNQADSGGAIYNRGNLTITNCILKYNNATFGGAVDGAGYLNITKSTVEKNNANFGGAFYILPILFNDNNDNGQNKEQTEFYINYNKILDNNATINGSAIYIQQGLLQILVNDGKNLFNAQYNWWGTNKNPANINNLVVGNVVTDPWVILSVNANPKTINNGAETMVESDLNHVNGSGGVLPLTGGQIPDGTIQMNIPWGSFSKTGIEHTTSGISKNGIFTATFYANEGAVKINPVEVTASTDGYTSNATESAYINITPKYNLYLKITSNNTHPVTGETFKITYKLGNYGPDPAGKVTIILPLPKGFTVKNIVGDGTWTITGDLLTWTLTSVPVGDPILNITGKVTIPGNYTFRNSLSAEALTVTVKNQTNNNSTNNNTNNSSTIKYPGKTIPMQDTGLPVAPLAIAVIGLLGSIASSRREK